MDYFISIWLKFFFLLTPFFVLSMFLVLTKELDNRGRRKVAVRVTGSVILVCFGLYFFGNAMFRLFGITVDSFRVGAGTLLFLSAVGMVQGKKTAPPDADEDGDIAVVPLAIPITVGPATTGALLVMGTEVTDTWHRVVGCAALLFALLCVGALMFLSASIERIIGRKGLTILSKLTGLVLAALAAQIIFAGVRNLLAS